jgi:Fic-DOC domain mobile mystery protein B
MTPPWPIRAGETPLDDLAGLKDPRITTRAELAIAEAANIARAFVRFVDFLEGDFDYSFTLDLHRHMFGDVWEWAGKVRRIELNLGLPPEQVEAQLLDLTKCLPFWVTMPAAEQAARLHHRAVQIHPFLNGNGRWSRMLANVWAGRQGHPQTIWPEQDVAGESVIRQEYLTAIRAADHHDLKPLIALHIRYAESA